MNEKEKNKDDLSRNDSFRVPDGYFEELPGKIADTIKSLESRNDAKNPFAVPDGYFEYLPGQINQKITSKRTIPFYRRAGVLIPAACLVLLFGYFLLREQSTDLKTNYVTMEDVDMSNYLFSIDEQILIDELAGLQPVESSDSLTQYILDNNIDLSEIESTL